MRARANVVARNGNGLNWTVGEGVPYRRRVLGTAQFDRETDDEDAGAEQGYWKEITDDGKSIRELHLHSKGFSVTCNPFETYKDCWGSYALNENEDDILLTVTGGNDLPDFRSGSGSFQPMGSGQFRISGIGLDSRRPAKRSFRFERFHPKQSTPGVAVKASPLASVPRVGRFLSKGVDVGIGFGGR